MKISLDWIKDFVSIPEEIPVSRIAYDLTMATVEVEGVTDLAREFENMAVGEILEILPHPNADKLVVCSVDLGDGPPREIVCGGSNLSRGMKVAVAKPGALVRWHGEGEKTALKNAKVRGVESYGMICSSSEIGLLELFPFTQEATIVDLSGFGSPAGTPLADALGLRDEILEIDNKSLTNRPDLWGHHGIAREIAALYDLPLRSPELYAPDRERGYEIQIDDPQRCPRYIGVRIEGLCVKPSTFQVQSRIWRVGMKPHNAIVDVTNYVMLATGQPTHAFDSDNIKGHIIVRRARDGEKLTLLSGAELSLRAEDLVIADEENAVALAGVMGGEKDSILPSTEKVILEIANFQAPGVRKTSARHEVRTEAASRFEKGIDPERCDIALSMAMKLFGDMFPGLCVTGFGDNYPGLPKRSEIDVSLDWLDKRLGMRIPDEVIGRKLRNLGFELRLDGDIMHLTAPTWRSTGDVSIPADIMEEIARMHGFENFDEKPITTTFTGAINQPGIDIDRRIREYLAFRCGMNEVYTYPWVEDAYIAALNPGWTAAAAPGEETCPLGAGMLSLATPISADERFIRSSLLPNLCRAAAENLRYYKEFAIFESAQVFFDGGFSSAYDPRETLPMQRRHVAGAFVGNREEYAALFRKAKGVIEGLPRHTHSEPLEFKRITAPGWADGVIWLNIAHGEETVGNLGLLAKKAALDCGIKNGAAMLFEIDIDALCPLPSRSNGYERIPEYPMVEYDISMLYDAATTWEEIVSAIAAKKGPDGFIQDVAFVDEYRGRQVPAGKKSVTLRLLIGSLKKTLTSEEIESCAGTATKRLIKVLGAAPR